MTLPIIFQQIICLLQKNVEIEISLALLRIYRTSQNISQKNLCIHVRISARQLRPHIIRSMQHMNVNTTTLFYFSRVYGKLSSKIISYVCSNIQQMVIKKLFIGDERNLFTKNSLKITQTLLSSYFLQPLIKELETNQL